MQKSAYDSINVVPVQPFENTSVKKSAILKGVDAISDQYIDLTLFSG
jgi:hypothetical protein